MQQRGLTLGRDPSICREAKHCVGSPTGRVRRLLHANGRKRSLAIPGQVWFCTQSMGSAEITIAGTSAERVYEDLRAAIEEAGYAAA